MDGGRFFNGLLLVAIGLLFLGVNLGYFDWGILANLWRFWPVLLILMGASIIMRRAFSWVVMAIVIAALIFPFWGGAAGTKETTETFQRSLPANVNSGVVGLKFGAGRLTVGGTTSEMAEGIFTYGAFAKPNVDFSSSGGKASLRITQRANTFVNWNLGGRLTHTWDLKLNPTIPLDVNVDAGACEANLDFSEYMLRRADVHTGASQVSVTFGSLFPQVSAKISAGASDITIKVPAGAGVRITQSGGLSSHNLDTLGWEKTGKTYQSPEYSSAATKIDLTIDTGASNLKVIKTGTSGSTTF